MSKARDLADFQGSASALTTGTLPVDRVPYVGRRNLIINGGFDVWQRSEDTGTVTSSVGYRSADRWITHGSGGTYRHNHQTIPMGDESLVGGCTNFSRFYTSVGNNNCGLGQKVEGVRSIPAYGQFTLSFYAKGTNPAGGNYAFELYGVYGTGNDSRAYSFSVTSEWQRITITDNFFAYSDKTLSGTDMIELWWRQPNGDTSTGAWTLDITGVQLELGSVATPFEHRSYGEELALCKRYFEKGNVYTTASAGNRVRYFAQYRTPKRALATIAFTSSNPNGIGNGGGIDELHGFDIFGVVNDGTAVNEYYTVDAEL